MDVIEFSYTLTEREIYDGLRYSGVYHTTGKRAVIESLLLLAFALVFFASYIWRPEIFNLIMGFVTLGVLAAVIAIPRLDMRKQAKKGQRAVNIEIYPDKMTVETEADTRTVRLDGTSYIRPVGKQGKLIAVNIVGGNFLIIPVRAIPFRQRTEAIDLLLQGQEQ